MTTRMFTTATIVTLTLAVGTAFGQAEKSLDKCQKAAAKQSSGHVKARTKALAKCLQKISGALIKSGAADPAAAAKPCASALRKLVNTADTAKTVGGKAKIKMRKACDPGFTALAHTTNQVLSLTPVGVTEGIEGANLSSYCSVFGGDGSLDSVEEWVDCQVAVSQCEANQQISVEYPRALEWLDAIRPEIVALGADIKYLDAVAALDELLTALDGNDDDVLDINCGPGNSVCGNGVIDANEECDSANLNGQTCVTVGFPDGGTLGCKGNCGFNYTGCFSSTFAETGLTTCYNATHMVAPCPGTGWQDGEVQAGPEISFTDNGSTITDNNTGLIWEKLSDDGSIHDQDDGYKWTQDPDPDDPDITDKILVLNTMPCFAGHCDWRVPNRHELASILDLGRNSPAMHPVFHTGCTLNCTILTCSCGPSAPFWTSTTWAGGATQAFYINFTTGRTDPNPKSIEQHVRAVRGPD